MESKKLDDWQNVRGPRPWEDSKEMQAEQRAQFAAQNAAQQSWQSLNFLNLYRISV